MSARAFEAFLARIYVDKNARDRFKANPHDEAKSAGLSEEECAALEKTDWVGLEMATRSFAHKRQMNRPNGSHFSLTLFLHRLFARCSDLFHRRHA